MATLSAVLTWAEFERQRPDLARAGRDLFYWVGDVGLGFLSTVRKDGGPRVHPMCPLLHEGRLLAFIIPSPKANDLARDGRYAMHSFPLRDNEDAFYITGMAREVTDAGLRRAAATQYWAERKTSDPPPQSQHDRLFEFLIDTAMVTRTTGHGDWAPVHTIWKASESGAGTTFED
jgi:hypothetical protein